MASSSSFCSTSPKQKYDVFLSFRGKDTRDNFTSHLYAALCRSKIKTFMDDPELRKGDRISPSLQSAIEGSAISVVIFSPGYASSRWCLDELVNILQCKDKYDQIVIPVFYHVEPSHVRNQTGAFADGFAKLEKRCKDSLQTWKDALTEAADLSGFDSKVIRPEALLVENIVNYILGRLKDQSPSIDDKDLVGVDLRVEDIKKMLCIGSGGVRKLGIWGIGGIGKTTLAETVFKRISKYFESSYFIQNIREESERGRLREMGRELISTILEDRHPSIGCIFTKNRLSCKKVFIVFDDVMDFQQIKSLIGDLEYLGPGSRIIITTRDKDVLKNCEVDEIYEAQVLSYDDSLQLFSQYAFRQNCPKKNYVELSTKVVKYAGGIPLALKTLGSFLFDRTKQEWHSTIDNLGKGPRMDILKVLKISYDGLEDDEKEMFLNIACFHKGEKINDVKKILDAWGFSSEIGIKILIEKSLITISFFDSIQMHDLLQEMGKTIVQQEAMYDPGKHSRLCYPDDIYRVLTENMGTRAILGICLDMSKIEEIHLNHSTFTKMCNLRFLKFYKSSSSANNVHGFEGIESNFRALRYLFVEGYPAKSLSPNMHFRNLVELHLPTSNIEELRLGNQSLDNLKHLDLSWSKHLVKISDLSLAPNLEQLVLGECPRLQEITSSDLHLNKLVYLDLESCCSFNSLPIISLSKSLTKINLRDCSWLEYLPNGIRKLKYLTDLVLSGCSRLKSLPNGIRKLKSLEYLSLSGCSRLESLPNGISKLKSLEFLGLSDCSRLESLPNGICKLESLGYLFLSGCSRLKSLPNGIGKLKSLRDLDLSDCSTLESLPNGIRKLKSLQYLDFSGCSRLESLPNGICELESLPYLGLSGCSRLESLPNGIRKLKSLTNLILFGCSRLESLPNGIRKLKSLTKLSLSSCSRLESLPNGICELESLLYLRLSDCSRLESLPNGIHKLKSLMHLDLSGCSGLESLPNGICKLKSLDFLSLSRCSRLKSLPNGICKLKSLTRLYLSHCSQLDNLLEQLETGQSFLELPSVRLRTLDLNGCCITELPYNLGQLSSMRELRLGGNNFESLPASIKNLTCLETLNLSNCERLRSLPELPLSLRKLEAQGCTSLEEEPSVLFNFLRLTNNLAGDFINRRNFSPLDPRRFCFPGSEIPKWFNFQSTGSSLRLPPGWCDDNFSGFAVGVVVSFSDCKGEGFGLRLACDLIVDHEPIQMHTWISWSRTDIDYIKSDHVLLEYNVKIATVISGARSKFDNKKASIKFYFVDHKENEVLHGCRIKKCGVHLFTDRFVPIEMKRSWCPLGQNKRKRSSCPGGQNKRKRLLCPGRAAIPLTRALLLRAMVASRRNKRSKAQ